MIIRILSSGTSFKGLATYLTHDPEAKTAERVSWTHTLNLAHDDALSAVDEMLWTARNAELLKQEAGIRAGGRATENPVKHLSLNWSPEDHPTREHMIEATEDFLRHMKWHDRQALLVAHEDKAHPHVHVMLNVVHPETGLRLDDGFERRRAQAWALDYEREQGNIRCANRLNNICDRDEAPTRPAWMAFKGMEKSFDENERRLAAFEPAFEAAPENPGTQEAKEWKALKKIQREERADFFTDGKKAFSDLRLSIYREVREEFRPQWADYYAAEKSGLAPDALKEMKAALLAEQKAMLEERRDDACGALRESRNAIYRELLDGQREMRHGLSARQAAGLNSLELIDHFRVEGAAREEHGHEPATARDTPGRSEPPDEQVMPGRTESAGIRSAPDIGANISAGLALGFLSFLADGLVPSNPAPRPKQAEPEVKRDLFDFAAEQARSVDLREKELAALREDEERRARSRQ
jgi:MobA/VirD2-like, nuclease domain